VDNLKPLPAAHLTLYADLLQQLQASSVLPASVRSQKLKNGEYLKANATIGQVRTTQYLGSAKDERAQRQARAMAEEMQRAKTRRQTVRLLRNAGFPAPSLEVGRILEALAAANLFRRGLVLIGTAAYQCYSPLVGAILPAASMLTQDLDLATASLTLPPTDGGREGARTHPAERSLEDILKQADPSFTSLPGLNPKALPSRFRTRSGFLVDMLVPIRKRSDTDPMPIPVLRAAATPVQQLDWLIENPASAAALHGSGILIRLPDPARYAVHKLILAQKRPSGSAKRRKDLLQAKALMQALRDSDPYALNDAMKDARSRGKSGWQVPLERSLREVASGPSLNGS
jgi:hypothetical protein